MSDTEHSNMNTGDFSDKVNFGWITKVKVLPVALVAFAALAGATGFYLHYTTNLDKNRQSIAHVAELRQLTMQVEKNGLLIKNVDPLAFSELELSKNRVDKLLKVLQTGGKVDETNAEIDAIESSFTEKFNKVQKNWSSNKEFIDALLGHTNELLALKKAVVQAQANSLKVSTSLNVLQNHLKSDPKLEPISRELYILNLRINQNLADMFSGDTFSLVGGYELVKDLRSFDRNLQGIVSGDELLGIEKGSEETIAFVKDVQNNFVAYKSATLPILRQVENLNTAKEVEKVISKTAQEISTTAQEINTSLVNQGNQLTTERNIAILLFILSLASFGLLALVFYEKSLQALRFAQILEKNQNNESAVSGLIAKMIPLDEGDFTQKITVEDKFVLPIAQKVDNTREIFGNIVRKIKASAAAVQYSANETDKQSKELLVVASDQYSRLESTIMQLSQITSEMDEVAQATWIAQDESTQSRDASQNGEQLVQQSIQKMTEIRNTIQESSKMIKKSSESAQAITEVTGLIQSITRQIEVLALNAAIQAASSGESGREFTVVAQEVQRLAFDSKEATNNILALVKEVQEDIGGAVSSMERTTQEVVEGAKLNDKAGQALKQIQALSQQVATRVMEASHKIEEKSAEMTTVSLGMKDLQGITQQNTVTVKATVEEVEALKQVSKELEGAVHGFKVD